MMSPLLRKEVRLLMPAFGLALVLAVVPIWLLRDKSVGDAVGLAFYAFCLGVVVLAVSCFGREFALSTFRMLLAQPIGRGRILWTKVAVLVLAIAVVLSAWLASCSTSQEQELARHSLPERSALSGALILGSMVVGGLWTALLLRQFVAAIVITILTPIAISGLIAWSGGADQMVYAALGLYIALGAFWTVRQFLRAQEVGWTGGVLTLSSASTRDAIRESAVRTRRPLFALVAKEFQLHKINLAGMAALFVLHLVSIVVRKAGPKSVGELLTAGLEAFGLLWLVVPWLIGSHSVAEERNLGTVDGLMCLPVSKGRQYAIKLLFVVVLGAIVSASLSCAAEGIGKALGVRGFSGATPMELLGLFLPVSLIAFYASTLSRNIIQALGLSLATAIFLGASIVLYEVPLRNGLTLAPKELAYLVFWPTALLPVVWLAYRNFKGFAETRHLALRNAFGLAGALLLTITSTAAIHQRLWEFLTPIEPPHGPARIRGAKPLLRSDATATLSLVMPDGRVWVDRIIHEPGHLIMKLDASAWIRLGGKWIGEPGRHFIDGSNWVEAVGDFQETVGIRSDGTLWVSEAPRQPFFVAGNGELHVAEPSKLMRFGGETNWLSVVRDGQSQSMVLLKTDGTLWRWGTNGWLKSWPGLRTFEPYQRSLMSNWARLFSAGPSIYGWQRDGRAWLLNSTARGGHVLIERRDNLDGIKWRSFTQSGSFHAAVREDGTLWVWLSPPGGVDPLSELQKENQYGKNINWAAVAISHLRLLALKSDGTLWKWDLSYSQAQSTWVLADSPVRLGIHSDWVALSSFGDGFVTLAGDGTLWFWPASERSDDQPLLASSRKPSKIVNLFD